MAGTRTAEAFGLYPIADAPAMAESVAAGRRLSANPVRLETAVIAAGPDCDFEGSVGALAATAGRRCLATPSLAGIASALRVSWLSGCDLALTEVLSDQGGVMAVVADLRAVAALPMRVFLHLADGDLVRHLPADLLGPVVSPLPLGFVERRALLERRLGNRAAELGDEIARAARDFRLEPRGVERVVGGLLAQRGKLPPGTLVAACRAETRLDLRDLAESVVPRFRLGDIVLPPAIARQLAEVVAAIRNSGSLPPDAHAGPATGEIGIALLFSGVPGTGKTMAAEVIAAELDLPLYRIDLSQVVNKYIGETEKNLKRVFDATEVSRSILFFDEADALFGKRTEVRDANDRFANVETGYLLQRMERYRGIAILATNRRRDLDEAFTRRLRYAIEFPVPGASERADIWRRVFPPRVDLAGIDIGFLAARFQLTGGHIRSIALNACLQAGGAVTMRDVLIATKRELDKLNWTAGADLFGRYFAEIEELRT